MPVGVLSFGGMDMEDSRLCQAVRVVLKFTEKGAERLYAILTRMVARTLRPDKMGPRLVSFTISGQSQDCESG